MDEKGKDLTANMLLLNIEFKHMENKVQLYDKDKAFYSEPCKIGFILTCKEEYRKTADFKDLVTEAETVAETAEQTAAQTCSNVFRETIYKK